MLRIIVLILKNYSITVSNCSFTKDSNIKAEYCQRKAEIGSA